MGHCILEYCHILCFTIEFVEELEQFQKEKTWKKKQYGEIKQFCFCYRKMNGGEMNSRRIFQEHNIDITLYAYKYLSVHIGECTYISIYIKKKSHFIIYTVNQQKPLGPTSIQRCPSKRKKPTAEYKTHSTMCKQKDINLSDFTDCFMLF